MLNFVRFFKKVSYDGTILKNHHQFFCFQILMQKELGIVMIKRLFIIDKIVFIC